MNVGVLTVDVEGSKEDNFGIFGFSRFNGEKRSLGRIRREGVFKNCLDGGKRNHFTAELYEAFKPALKGEQAIVVDTDEVAGVVPEFAVYFDEGGFSGIIEIAGKNTWASNKEQPRGGRREGLEGFRVNEEVFEIGEDFAD